MKLGLKPLELSAFDEERIMISRICLCGNLKKQIQPCRLAGT
jgi:hypothetical protein